MVFLIIIIYAKVDYQKYSVWWKSLCAEMYKTLSVSIYCKTEIKLKLLYFQKWNW